MSSHDLKGLRWAKRCEEPPAWARASRKRGSAAAGRAYEKKVAKALGPRWTHGPWFQFQDSAGLRWCQPDFLLELPRFALVLEAKLGDSWGHRPQVELYKAVVGLALEKPVLGIVVAKNLSRGVAPGLIVDSLRPAAELALRAVPTLHWLGHTPLQI